MTSSVWHGSSMAVAHKGEPGNQTMTSSVWHGSSMAVAHKGEPGNQTATSTVAQQAGQHQGAP